jgi:YHS domain-containing protein
MTFFARVFRFLFWLLVISWSVALLKYIVRRMLRQPGDLQDAASAHAPADAPARRLVRDPVCGMHVAENLAFPIRRGNEVVYFCSVECRTKYESEIQPKAANG